MLTFPRQLLRAGARQRESRCRRPPSHCSDRRAVPRRKLKHVSAAALRDARPAAFAVAVFSPEYAARNKRYTPGTNQPKQTYSRISRSVPNVSRGLGGVDRPLRANFFASLRPGDDAFARAHKRESNKATRMVPGTRLGAYICVYVCLYVYAAITFRGFFYAPTRYEI